MEMIFNESGLLVPKDTQREAMQRTEKAMLTEAMFEHEMSRNPKGETEMECETPTPNDKTLPRWLSLEQNETSFSHDDPHAWIQWKGTDVCADIHCACGAFGHIDGQFMYFVKCDKCGRIYEVNGHVQLIERDKSTEAEYQTSGSIHTFFDE